MVIFNCVFSCQKIYCVFSLIFVLQVDETTPLRSGGLDLDLSASEDIRLHMEQTIREAELRERQQEAETTPNSNETRVVIEARPGQQEEEDQSAVIRQTEAKTTKKPYLNTDM